MRKGYIKPTTQATKYKQYGVYKKHVKITIALPAELKSLVEDYCYKYNTYPSQIFRNAIIQYLGYSANKVKKEDGNK